MDNYFVENLTTGEIGRFNLDVNPDEFLNFLRKAVIDFIGSHECTVSLGNDKYLTYDPDTDGEPLFWVVAGILFMKCRESGEWGDIANLTKIYYEGDEEVD